MKKLLLTIILIISVGFTACENNTDNSNNSNGITLNPGDYKAPFAEIAPVIDGKGDDPAWEKAEWAYIDQVWLGGGNASTSNLSPPSAADFTGRFKIVWTKESLYFLAEITDDVIVSGRPWNSGQMFNDDILEIFIDEDASGGPYGGASGANINRYNAFAHHLNVDGDNGMFVAGNTNGGYVLLNHFVNYVIDNANGSNLYTWEVELKIVNDTYTHNAANPTIPEGSLVELHEGKVMGFAVAYCDADQSGSREHFMGSVPIAGADKNVAYMNASVFGKLYLVKDSSRNPISIDETSIVSIVQSDKAQASDLTYDDIKALVAEAVALAGGLESVVKTGDTVVLKPNLVLDHDTTLPGYTGVPLSPELNGVCTDWRVTKAAAELVREIIGPTGKIYIMEGSSKYTTTRHYNNLGYTRSNFPVDLVDEIIALESEGTWRNLNHADFLRRSLPQGEFFNTETKESYYNADGVYYVSRRMYEADVIICLPVLKNHWHTVTTGAVKNLAIGATPPNIYGINSSNQLLERNNMVTHSNSALHNWIVDYYTIMPAHFVIMDGLQGVDYGPVPGVYAGNITNINQAQKNKRTILASKDALAIDIVQANVMNWDIDSIRYLRLLTEAGNVGNGNPENITVLGNKVDDIREDFGLRLMNTGTPANQDGRPLTDAQKTPPAVLSIVSAQFVDQSLNINLNISPNDTVKVDVYINSDYAGSVNSNMNNITIDASNIPNGEHAITVYSYNRWMAHKAAYTTVTK